MGIPVSTTPPAAPTSPSHPGTGPDTFSGKKAPLVAPPGRALADAEFNELQARVHGIMRIRWFTIPLLSVFLLILSRGNLAMAPADLSGFLAHWVRTHLAPQIALSVASIGMNFAYLYAIRNRKNLMLVANLQVGADALLYTAQVHYTGGATSPLYCLYVVPVLEAAVLLGVRSALLAAFFNVMLFGGLSWMEFSGRLAHVRYFTIVEDAFQRPKFVLLMVLVCAFTSVLVALLSSFFVATIRRQERRLKDANRSLDRKVSELSTLAEVANTLQETTNLHDVLQKILNTLVVRLNMHRALLYLVNERKQTLELKLVAVHPQFADQDSTKMHVEMPLKPTTVTALAALQRRAYNVSDPMANPLVNKALASTIGFNPFAVAPMLVRGKAIGVIGVDRRHAMGALTEEELRLLGIFANHAGLTIHSAQKEHGGALLKRQGTNGRPSAKPAAREKAAVA